MGPDSNELQPVCNPNPDSVELSLLHIVLHDADPCEESDYAIELSAMINNDLAKLDEIESLNTAQWIVFFSRLAG